MLVEHELQVEFSRTVAKQQYAVQLTYADGRVTHHIRQSRESAERMVDYHRDVMRREPEWKVASADLAVRDITVIISEWREPQ